MPYAGCLLCFTLFRWPPVAGLLPKTARDTASFALPMKGCPLARNAADLPMEHLHRGAQVRPDHGGIHGKRQTLVPSFIQRAKALISSRFVCLVGRNWPCSEAGCI